MARPRGVRLLATILACLTIKLFSVDGRKCVCTSKPCLEAGLDTCRTRFSCYTELILIDEGQGNTTTRGCTETATPLLCESRPRSASLESNDTALGHLRVRWPRLKCCDSHDYCNSGVSGPQDHRKPTSTVNRPVADPVVNLSGTIDKPSDPPDRYHDKKTLDSTSSSSSSSSSASTVCTNGLNSLTTQQVKPLHVAALVLTVAALISVFAACYVITSILRSHPQPASERGGSSPACKCRSEPFAGQNLDYEINIRNDLRAIKSLEKSAPPTSVPLFV